MITRQQVADLRVGDIVQIEGWYGLTVQGPVSDSRSDGSLWLGQHIRLTYTDGDTGNWLKSDEAHLVLIARAPRPLYVNHPRTEPVGSDVMRREGDDPWRMFGYSGDRWVLVGGTHEYETTDLQGAPFRLLVDGDTGQVVP